MERNFYIIKYKINLLKNYLMISILFNMNTVLVIFIINNIV